MVVCLLCNIFPSSLLINEFNKKNMCHLFILYLYESHDFAIFEHYPLTSSINQNDPCPSSISEQAELQGGAGCAKG